MRKATTLVVTFLAVFTLCLSSCIFDPKEKGDDGGGGGGGGGGEILPLTVRDNVLNNLQVSYNQRKIDEYKRLLDDDFIFHFSAADIRDNNVSVEQWDRSAELGATTNMFDPTFSPPNGAPISSIDLELTYPDGDEAWNPIVDPDPVNHPGETWYEKTVDYFLNVQAGDVTYTSANPIPASFVVREAEVDGQKIWRIIIWRDDI